MNTSHRHNVADDRRRTIRIVHSDASTTWPSQNGQTQARPDRRRKPRTVRVNHWKNLILWAILAVGVLAISEFRRFFPATAPVLEPTSAVSTDVEKEAFIALNFGRMITLIDPAAHAEALKKQLTALKAANYTSVRVEQINRWQQTPNATLPARPVLLTFDEPKRETMEIADETLAALKMSALVFVDVNKLNQSTLQWVSWHRLEELARSGRWEIGISACVNSNDALFSNETLLTQKLIQQREQLQQRLHIPIIAANCSKAEQLDSPAKVDNWHKALKNAALQTGFVVAAEGANYRTDTTSDFRRVDVLDSATKDNLLAQLNRYTPRRTAFVDRFQSKDLDPNWIVDKGLADIKDVLLHLQNKPGEPGALITLGGTEKWKDAAVEVTLKNKPSGQFWLALRQESEHVFLRLGIVNDKVMLQESNGAGNTKLLTDRHVSADPITLKLRVIDHRVMAYLNGSPLLSRPAEIAHLADYGRFSLAVWHQDSLTPADDGLVAEANIVKVSATPLTQKGIVIAPKLTPTTWMALRQHSEALTLISPNYFTWTDSEPRSLSLHNTPLEIFAHHHHLKLMPALSIVDDTPTSDIPALTKQALSWASDPAYQGLNIVLKNPSANPEWQAFLNQLHQRMQDINKTLMVTLLDDKDRPLPLVENAEPLLIADRLDFVSTRPTLLYPHTAEATRWIFSGERTDTVFTQPEIKQ